MEPTMTAPMITRFTWCMAYVTFASVVGDGFGMSSRRADTRRSGEGLESVGVLGSGVGMKMFERD